MKLTKLDCKGRLVMCFRVLGYVKHSDGPEAVVSAPLANFCMEMVVEKRMHMRIRLKVLVCVLVSNDCPFHEFLETIAVMRPML